MTPSILITGGSGLLALNWAIALRGRSAVTLGLHQRQVSLDGVATRQLPLDDVAELGRGLDALDPQLVVHTAGLTSIEACESDPQLAHLVNVDLAVNVAVACAERRLPMVHISTDHVVRGDEPLVSETHAVAPKNVYARTKAAAEGGVLDAHPDALIVRTNFYGWGPSYRRSFSERIVHALRQREAIDLFTDVFFTPIIAERLIEAVHDLVDRKAKGVMHVVGDERISKHEFGHRLAREFGLDGGLIRPGLLSEQPALVQRPHDMSLSNAKVCRELGRSLGGVDAHLVRLHEQEQLGMARELQAL